MEKFDDMIIFGALASALEFRSLFAEAIFTEKFLCETGDDINRPL